MNFPTPSPGHVNCRCGMLNVPGCQGCKRCHSLCGCTCRHCYNCNAKHPRHLICHNCNRCKRPTAIGCDPTYHCTCRQRPKHLIITRPGIKVFRSLTLRRAIGLEIELSNPGVDPRGFINNSRTIAMQWVHDGSITAGGQELVIMPMMGQQLLDQLNYVTEGFRRNGAEVDLTCGYHVHTGADDFGAHELRRLLVLYHRFENIFYELAAPGRDKAKRNGRGELKCYCARLPWKASWYETLLALKRPSEIRRFLVEQLYPNWVGRGITPTAIDMRGARRHKYEQCRYYGLNLHTWFERGTVEYRHHEGTMDRDALLYWALWCAWFTEFASALSDRQVSRIYTLGDLLFTEFPTGRGPLRMPSDVANYVLRTREEKHGIVPVEYTPTTQPVA